MLSKESAYAALVLMGLLTLLSFHLREADSSSPEDATLVRKGKRIAAHCATCHSLDRRINKIGPHLVSILGRKAGSIVGFNYSPAMADARFKWGDEELLLFLTSPQSMIPGSSMATSGLSESDARAVLSYLRSLE